MILVYDTKYDISVWYQYPMILVYDIIFHIIVYIAWYHTSISYMISYIHILWYWIWYQIWYHYQCVIALRLLCHPWQPLLQQLPCSIASSRLLPWSCSALADTVAPDPLSLCNGHYPGASPAVAPHPDVHIIEPGSACCSAPLALSRCESAEALPRLHRPCSCVELLGDCCSLWNIQWWGLSPARWLQGRCRARAGEGCWQSHWALASQPAAWYCPLQPWLGTRLFSRITFNSPAVHLSPEAAIGGVCCKGRAGHAMRIGSL